MNFSTLESLYMKNNTLHPFVSQVLIQLRELGYFFMIRNADDYFLALSPYEI